MSNTSFAQIQDNIIDDPGDIAIVAHHTDGAFSFALLDNCPAGTNIMFTDEEWTGTAWATTTSEGHIKWTTTSLIPCGTVVHVDGRGTSHYDVIVCSHGTATETDSGFNTIDGDGLFAFISSTNDRTVTPTAFLTYYGNATGTGTSLTGTGLTDGVNALTTGAVSAGRYTGGTTCTGTVIECADMINTTGSWTSGIYTVSSDVVQFFNGTVLPVELMTFDAQTTEGSKTHLNWSTGSEVNSHSFDIERSRDGATYTKIGNVKAQGKAATYAFVDNSPLSHTNYYRLKSMDNDQTFAYSKVVSVQHGKSKTAIKVYPTATDGVLTVENNGWAVDAVTVFNHVGQIVLTTAATNSVNLSALPSGMYLVQVQAGAERVVEKVFKQ